VEEAMNTMAWLVAMVSMIALSVMFFTDFSGATFEMIGWVCIGLTFFCIVMVVDALMSDISTRGGFGE
jgi:hypothetical protein